jgi:hypothetical protein
VTAKTILTDTEKADRFRKARVDKERLTVRVSERCVRPKEPAVALGSVTGRVKGVAANSAHVVINDRQAGECLIPMEDVVEIFNAKEFRDA